MRIILISGSHMRENAPTRIRTTANENTNNSQGETRLKTKTKKQQPNKRFPAIISNQEKGIMVKLNKIIPRAIFYIHRKGF